ncbi:GNAT family N-acetyltransferase [Spirosoma rhododendri]|uniref:GNAT family N-acetyltransferase n=1 Tax=Spirosoma rhododendri TaxID=2728024 RepID=A0A7L5DT38_9BACT|nr:GNAT family N-acetyltransferase [Spirosoma rhododendri]QJD80782.1 GNAT family N-acetyltransferase [Spirosoma rhododendri]
MLDSYSPVPSANGWQLTTDRLLLHQLTIADAPFMLALLNSPPWLRFIGDRNVYTLEAAEQYIQHGAMRSYEQYGFGTYRVSLRETGDAIGTCGLHRRTGLPDVDLGFAFLPGFNGKGYGFESASAVLSYAANELNLSRLTAFCDPDNRASVALIEKLGFVYEKRIQYGQKESLLYGKCIG